MKKIFIFVCNVRNGPEMPAFDSVHQGYWWQPRPRDGVQRLLYEEVDESKVLIVQLMSHDQNSLEEFR